MKVGHRYMARVAAACLLGGVHAVAVWAAEAPQADPLQASLQEGVRAYEAGEYDTAIAKLEKPASAYDRDALYYLGEAVYFHSARPGHLNHAYNVHKLGAEADDPRAQLRLAEMQLIGEGGPQDVDAAYAWLRKAMKAGYEPAMATMSQVYQARELARDWAGQIAASGLRMQTRPEVAAMPAREWGDATQVLCADAREAAVLSKVGQQLHGQMLRELSVSHFNAQPDQVVSRPLLAAVYAHAMVADRSLFKSCVIQPGLPTQAVSTGRVVPDSGLVELSGVAPEAEAKRFWLLPNQADSSGNRWVVQASERERQVAVGPQGALGKLYGCPREPAAKIVQGTAQPDALKTCLEMPFGTVVATGRSLKVSRTEESGFVQAFLLPEVVVLGQFGKVFYLAWVGG